MNSKYCLLLLLMTVCLFPTINGQNKIGANPTSVQSSALLELESTTKGLRLPRIALDDSTKWTLDGTAVSGMVIYNEAGKCVKGLYYWNTDSVKWMRFTYTSELSKLNKSKNGLNTSNGYIQLGGNLDQATTINTTSSNTLSIMGLQSGSATDSLVVVDPTAGTLKRISPSKLTTGQYVSTYSATMGQTTFLAPLTVTDANKIQVFRNGSLVGFTTTVGSNNVTIDFSNYDNGYLSGCLASDQIKIYQWK